MAENKDTKAEVKKITKTKVAKSKPKRIRTIEDMKALFLQLETLNKLIAEVKKGDVSFYTQQNPQIFALAVRPTAIPKDVEVSVLSYLNEQLQKKRNTLVKIITGE